MPKPSAKPDEEPKGPTRETIEESIRSATSGGAKDAVVKLFDMIMVFAHMSRASDVHLEPWKEHSQIRLRVDGILHDEFELGPALYVQIVARLKILTEMRTDEHRSPQDGRFKYTSPIGDVDVRVSILPTSFGEKVVLRLLSSQSHKLSLDQLGFSPDDLRRIEKAIRKPWGMILATGPTGSGKTTSIYAILEILNKREVNIATIEDPVEFEIPGVNQSQVDHVAKLTFASGLRSLLRQDPDILMVGEIRDQETAKIAVNAALTGHKLLSTLHTNDAVTSVARLIDMGVEPFLISSTLICCVAQRLVRRVCPDCVGRKEFLRKDVENLLGTAIISELFGKSPSVEVAAIKGCAKCKDTGYRGRVGIYEVLENSPALQQMIIARASKTDMERVAREEGMTSMTQDGIRKILSFETTIEELIRVMQE
ncbi:MAG: GspE/PulE family protein [Candidatus Uhrbacteria bacterium]